VTTPARRAAKPKAGAKAKPVVFRGPPDRLASLVPLAGEAPAEEAAAAEATLNGAEVRGLAVRSTARLGKTDARKATLKLPKTTPPGTYRGTAVIEGKEVPIVAEVEGRARLDAHPRRVALEATPGARTTVALTLVNTGNVPCDVPGTSTFCLFDGRGIEHAVWMALEKEPPKGKGRMDVFLDDLASSHGGLVAAKVEKPAKIPPGESSEVTLTLRFPDRLQAGGSYSGAWEAGGIRVPVRITVPEAKPTTTRKAAAR
jgi:hypothetical protein